MGLISKIKEEIGDWIYITLRQLHLVKCDNHGWTYIIDDTETDMIQCPFCWKTVFAGDFDFEDIKQKIILWRYGEFCRPAEWTRELEKELQKIADRNNNANQL